MNAYSEAKCPGGHAFLWLTGTPFVCPVCKYQMNKVERPAPNVLTPREYEVVALIAEGLTSRQIASELVIQECTVENHSHRILTKLNLTTRTQVARFAWENGILRKPG